MRREPPAQAGRPDRRLAWKNGSLEAAERCAGIPSAQRPDQSRSMKFRQLGIKAPAVSCWWCPCSSDPALAQHRDGDQPPPQWPGGGAHDRRAGLEQPVESRCRWPRWRIGKGGGPIHHQLPRIADRDPGTDSTAVLRRKNCRPPASRSSVARPSGSRPSSAVKPGPATTRRQHGLVGDGASRRRLSARHAMNRKVSCKKPHQGVAQGWQSATGGCRCHRAGSAPVAGRSSAQSRADHGWFSSAGGARNKSATSPPERDQTSSRSGSDSSGGSQTNVVPDHHPRRRWSAPGRNDGSKAAAGHSAKVADLIGSSRSSPIRSTP